MDALYKRDGTLVPQRFDVVLIRENMALPHVATVGIVTRASPKRVFFQTASRSIEQYVPPTSILAICTDVAQGERLAKRLTKIKSTWLQARKVADDQLEESLDGLLRELADTEATVGVEITHPAGGKTHGLSVGQHVAWEDGGLECPMPTAGVIQRFEGDSVRIKVDNSNGGLFSRPTEFIAKHNTVKQKG